MEINKLNKACEQLNDTWEKMMKESNPFDTVSKIAKDIADRQDKELALEFTKCIGELLRKNGVTPMVDEYKQQIAKENSIECKYGVAITGLDFTEHDKKFKNKITQLKHDLDKATTRHDELKKEAQDMITELQSDLEEWKAEARALKKNRDEMLANFRKGIEPYVDLQDMHDRISELESELEVKENLLKIKNGLCSSFDCLPCEPISVANMLINAKEEYEPSSLQKALTGTKEKCLIDKYSDDDLEQIAEHLLVYCRHNREDDE